MNIFKEEKIVFAWETIETSNNRHIFAMYHTYACKLAEEHIHSIVKLHLTNLERDGIIARLFP